MWRYIFLFGGIKRNGNTSLWGGENNKQAFHRVGLLLSSRYPVSYLSFFGSFPFLLSSQAPSLMESPYPFPAVFITQALTSHYSNTFLYCTYLYSYLGVMDDRRTNEGGRIGNVMAKRN